MVRPVTPMSERPSTPPALHLVSGDPPRPRRRTIAVLLDYMNFFGGGYEADLRRALDERARLSDADVLFVFGRALEEPRLGSVAHNVVFDLLDGGAVDGVIVVSTLLSGHTGPEGVAEFLSTRYRGLPRVSLGIAVPGVPSVVVDNRFGMRALIEHLIVDHQCRRIAFLGGTLHNPEAEARLSVYRETLEAHGLPFDPALVEPGLFQKRSAIGATRAILGRVRPDAVVAANDAMALGAIEALRRHGFRVPYDVPVTGFDDLSVARLANPPLTTVAQPFDDMAELAIDLLLEQLDGRPVAAVTHLSTVLTLRQSCGCGVRLSKGAETAPPIATREAALEDLTRRRGELEPLLVACLGRERPASAPSAAALLDALGAELGGETEAFSRTVEAQLERCGDDNESYRGLQNAISALRGELRRNETRELSDVWYDALSLVALANTTAQMQHRLAVDESYLRLLNASQAFSVAFDAASLRRMLVKGLPAAGVRTAVVARATNGALDELEPLVCLHEGQPVPVDSARYPGRRLFPPGDHWSDQRRSYLVFPLAFESQKLGLAIFDMSEGSSGQHMLRDQLSAALKSIELHEAVLLTTTQHERSLQERLAAAKRMQSLSVLAGGVAHDLNNALGPLVGLPDIIQRELSTLMTPATRDVRADLESIKAAALRASQTIKDLLTLGRQGHTRKDPLSLNQVVSSCVHGELQQQRADGRRVQIELDLCPEQVVVRASEAQIARAISNLVHNAIEAIPSNGRVRIKTSAASLVHPMPGYEQIDPGDYAVVTIADDGSGISPQELGRIFEPFFSTKRAGDRSGTGLGLAIVHGVVKEHDGFVDVASSPGEGTTFTLYFPRTRELPRVSERPEPPRRGRARILIVDDDPVQLRTGKRILSHLGYAVETQSRGTAAYQLFVDAKAQGTSPFELVILDMSLNEERDGLELFERIQELYPEQRAIVASGHALNERVEHAMARGLAWLAKPYTADALARTVQAALAGDAQASGF